MTQPTLNTSSTSTSHIIRSFPSNFSHIFKQLLSIPEYLPGLLVTLSAYCKTVWKYLKVIFRCLRFIFSVRCWRKLVFYYKLATTEPDSGLVILTVAIQLSLSVLVSCAGAILYVISTIPAGPIKRWANAKSKRVDVVSDWLDARADWAVKSTNVEFVTGAHDMRDTAVRRTRRYLHKTISALVHAVLPSTILRNVLQHLSVLCVWRWSSLDHLCRQNGHSESARRPLRAGFVRVRLGFPTLQRTNDDDPWGLSKNTYLMDDFPLEHDGSLYLPRVVQRWSLDEIQILDPNRFEPFQSEDPEILSRLALGVLTMRDGHLTIIEKRSVFTLRRMSLRFRLLASYPYYLLRLLPPVFAALSILATAVYSFIYIHRLYTVLAFVLSWLAIGVYEEIKYRVTGRQSYYQPTRRYPPGYMSEDYYLFKLWKGNAYKAVAR